MLKFALPEPTRWVAQLEWPQKVTCLLEIGSNRINLVNKILHAYHSILAQILFYESIIGKGNALLFNLAVAALVDQLANRFEVWVAISNKGLDDSEHLNCGFCETYEDAVVDL